MAIFGRSYPIRSAVKIIKPAGGGPETLSPSLFDDEDQFYSATISAGSVSLAPSLFTDDDAFFAPTITSIATFSPPLFDDTDTFFAPTVTAGALTLAADLFDDADEFFSPTVGTAAPILLPPLFTDSEIFFAPTVIPGAITLTAPLFTDTDAFFAPTVVFYNVLQPPLFVDTDEFFAALVLVNAITPSLFTDSDLFFAPTITSVGGLAPALFEDGDQFYSPSVGFSLGPALFVETDLFFSPTLIPGPVTVSSSLYVEQDVFYIPAVQRVNGQGGGGGGGGQVPANRKYASRMVLASSGLISALQCESERNQTMNCRLVLYADNAGVPGALLGMTTVKTSVVTGVNTFPMITGVAVLAGTAVWIALHTDGEFKWFLRHAPNGSRFNTDLFSDGPSDPFGSASIDNKDAPFFLVILEAVTATVSPPLMASDDVFYSPTSTTSKTLTAPLFSDADAIWTPVAVTYSNAVFAPYLDDADAIRTPVFSQVYHLDPALFDDDDLYFSPGVGQIEPPDQELFPSFMPSDDEFFSPTVLPMGADLPPDLFEDEDEFFQPEVLNRNTLEPELHDDADVIFTPEVTSIYSLFPDLVLDPDLFFDEIAVARIGGDFPIDPPHFEDEDVFYVAVIGNRGWDRDVYIEGEAAQVNIKAAKPTQVVDIYGEAVQEIDVEGERD